MVKRALIFLVAFIGVSVGLLVWHTQIEKAKAAKRVNSALTALSGEDVKILLESQYKTQPAALNELAESPEAVRELLEEQIKPLLAIAREARVTGLADEPEMRDQLELAEMEVLALAYDQKLKNDAGKPNDPGPPLGWASQMIKDEEVEDFYRNPQNEMRFEKFMKTLEERSQQKQKIPEEQRKYIRDQWARAFISAERARQAGLDQDRTTQLQIQFQQSRILAQEYGKRHAKEIQATKEDTEAYIREHPELNPAKVRETAEQVLARAKAGEDFAKLAAEYSADPGSKDKGGLYEGVKKGQFVPQFELAANNLEPGQIADKLVESQYGYHIIKLEGRGKTKDKDGKEEDTYNVRHILLLTQARDPNNPFAQPMNMEQKAQQEAQQAKIKKFLEGIMARNPIELPPAEQVKITAPALQEGEMEGMPGGMMPPPQMAPPTGGRGGGAGGAQPGNRPPAANPGTGR